MLHAMRRNTKIIMLVVAVAFVGLMVFQWGMDISGRSSPQRAGEIGRVNGEPISYQLWTATFRNLTDQARSQKGGPLNDLEVDLVEEQTWNQIVGQMLVDQEIERQGIRVSDDEIRSAFETMPPPWLQQNELFQTDGQFDFDKYRAFFSGPAADPLLLQQIEAYYRDVLPRARLFEEISSGIYVPDSDLWNIYRDSAEHVAIRYVVIDPETRVDDADVSVTDEELRAYYNEHLQDFEQPATALIRMVELKRTPGAADTAAALARATEFRKQIVDGAAFETVAEQNSADRASASRGGDLGWFGRGEMTPAFEAAAFALKPGEISEPVLSPFGYHIIKVIEKEADRVHASHILIKIGLRGESEDKLLGSVDRLERISLAAGLDAAVDSLGLSSNEVTLAKGSDFVPGLGRFGPVQDWAFHDSTVVGDVSPVYETNDGFVVFELEELTPEMYLSYEDAEASIRRRVVLEKKQETARWAAEQMAGDVRRGKSLEDVAAENGLAVQTTELFSRLDFVPGLGQSNEVIGTAFGAGTVELAGPVMSDGRFYLLEVTQRVEPDREAFERVKETMRAQLTMRRRQTAIDGWLADLHDKADIRDYRREFFSPRS